MATIKRIAKWVGALALALLVALALLGRSSTDFSPCY
jgi:hypothetical protein